MTATFDFLNSKYNRDFYRFLLFT